MLNEANRLIVKILKMNQWLEKSWFGEKGIQLLVSARIRDDDHGNNRELTSLLGRVDGISSYSTPHGETPYLRLNYLGGPFGKNEV